ncbi:caspase family protein [Actinosynnema sp. NPDC020468]|uniref:caspase, EACC1-associated type n=1 Tax=Actinosynnema sp. NPDC020468 TaxID=3154488 RepID=UPI0033C1BDA5
MGRHALLVATGDYADARLSRLRAPEQDVDRLAALLEDPDVGGFASVAVLKDEPKSTVERAVEDLLADRESDDLVLLYFSCHGLMNPARRLFFAAADTRQDRLASTALSRAFVNDQLEGCRAAGRVLVLDCCFSGAFSDGFKGGAEPVIEDRGEGYAVLTATNGYEYAYESSGDGLEALRSSVFTDVVIQGLASGDADLDGDRWIDVDELAKYTSREVARRTDRQTPMYFARGSGSLRIARAGAGGVPSGVRRVASYTSAQLLVAKGFRVAAEPVWRTLGPVGRRAVVTVDGQPVELGDASAIAEAYQPDDPRDGLGVGYVRDLVRQVRLDAGDGAASAVAVAQGAITGLVDAMRDGANPVRLMRGVDAAAKRAAELVVRDHVELLPGDVARLAASVAGSARIGRVVASVVERTGAGGPVVVERGQGFGLEHDFARGVRFDRGYASSLFVTDTARHEAVLDQARVLLVSGRVPEQVGPATLGRIFGDCPARLVVCEQVSHGLLTAVLGLPRPALLVAADRTTLGLLRVAVGGLVLEADLLGSAGTSALGGATKVVSSEWETSVIGPRADGDRASAAVLRASAADFGAVERAVRAVRGAAAEGVLRGGGVGLRSIGEVLAGEATGTPEEVAGWRAFATALAAPSDRLADNAAVEPHDLDPGLIDSAAVVRVVVEAAARTAARFLRVA